MATSWLSVDTRHSTLPPDIVTVAALVYLALPNLIFFGGWLRPLPGVVLIVMLVGAMAQFMRRPDLVLRTPQSVPVVVALGLMAFAWASLGGAGHLFGANPDWSIRDKVLGDLTLSAWPPAYSVLDGVPHILRSAVGLFFSGALAGKVFGLAHAHIALYIYTAIGCWLFFLLLPFPRRQGIALYVAVTLTMFFSGMDYLGILLMSGGETPIFPFRLEWWVPFSYSSLTGQMHWAPNHAIPLWLVATLFYRHWGNAAWPALFVVLLPLTVLWTPFAPASILPFMGIAVARWFSDGKRFAEARITGLQWLTAACVTWLMLRLMSLDIVAIPGAPTANVAPNPDRIFEKYVLFVLMEFGVLALLLTRGRIASPGLFGLSCAMLLVLPLYQYGPSSDAMLRLSTPCLVVLLIVVLGQVDDWFATRRASVFAWAMVPVLLIGAQTPLYEMCRSALYGHRPPNYSKSLVEQSGNWEPPHYVGRLDRPDLLWLLRPPSLVPNHAERQRRGLVPPL